MSRALRSGLTPAWPKGQCQTYARGDVATFGLTASDHITLEQGRPDPVLKGCNPASGSVLKVSSTWTESRPDYGPRRVAKSPLPLVPQGACYSTQFKMNYQHNQHDCQKTPHTQLLTKFTPSVINQNQSFCMLMSISTLSSAVAASTSFRGSNQVS